MAADTIRSLPVQTMPGRRSTETEVCSSLEETAKAEGRPKLGSLLTAIARQAGRLSDGEAEQLDRLRDRTPAKPIRFV